MRFTREQWIADFKEHAGRDPLVINLRRLRTAITTKTRKP